MEKGLDLNASFWDNLPSRRRRRRKKEKRSRSKSPTLLESQSHDEDEPDETEIEASSLAKDAAMDARGSPETGNLSLVCDYGPYDATAPEVVQSSNRHHDDKVIGNEETRPAESPLAEMSELLPESVPSGIFIQYPQPESVVPDEKTSAKKRRRLADEPPPVVREEKKSMHEDPGSESRRLAGEMLPGLSKEEERVGVARDTKSCGSRRPNPAGEPASDIPKEEKHLRKELRELRNALTESQLALCESQDQVCHWQSKHTSLQRSLVKSQQALNETRDENLKLCEECNSWREKYEHQKGEYFRWYRHLKEVWVPDMMARFKDGLPANDPLRTSTRPNESEQLPNCHLKETEGDRRIQDIRADTRPRKATRTEAASHGKSNSDKTRPDAFSAMLQKAVAVTPSPWISRDRPGSSAVKDADGSNHNTKLAPMFDRMEHANDKSGGGSSVLKDRETTTEKENHHPNHHAQAEPSSGKTPSTSYNCASRHASSSHAHASFIPEGDALSNTRKPSSCPVPLNPLVDSIHKGLPREQDTEEQSLLTEDRKVPAEARPLRLNQFRGHNDTLQEMQKTPREKKHTQETEVTKKPTRETSHPERRPEMDARGSQKIHKPAHQKTPQIEKSRVDSGKRHHVPEQSKKGSSKTGASGSNGSTKAALQRQTSAMTEKSRFDEDETKSHTKDKQADLSLRVRQKTLQSKTKLVEDAGASASMQRASEATRASGTSKENVEPDVIASTNDYGNSVQKVHKVPPTVPDRSAKKRQTNMVPQVSRQNDEDEPNYKYQEVVRCRDARRALPGHTCEECQAFVNAMCNAPGGHVFNKNQFMDCSRHRSRHTPPQTPEGFWELSFADEIEGRNEPLKNGE